MDDIERALDSGRLDVLVADVVDGVLDDYVLKKMPEGGTLEDFLAAYTKERLLNFSDENGLKVTSGWKKARVVESIKEDLLASLEVRFLILGERKVSLLQKMSDEKFDTGELARKEAEFYLTVYPAAVRLGLLYSAVENGEVSTMMPEEIKLHLDESLARFDDLKREYASEIQQWNEMEEVLHAGVHLYGTLTSSTIIDLWEVRYSKSEKIEEVIAFIQYSSEILPLLIIQNEYYLVRKYIIGSSQFVDAEDVERFYRYTWAKMSVNEYKPSKEDIQYYTEHFFDRRTADYKKLKRHVSKSTKDLDGLMDLIEKNIKFGFKLSDLMDEIAERELLLFETDKQFEKFVELYVELHNNSRLWENAGFTPMEMVEQAEIFKDL